jgi:hypothetical protein
MNIMAEEVDDIKTKRAIWQLIASVGTIKENVLNQKIDPLQKIHHVCDKQYLLGIIGPIMVHDRLPYPVHIVPEEGECNEEEDWGESNQTKESKESETEDESEHEIESEVCLLSAKLKEVRIFLDVLRSKVEKYLEIKDIKDDESELKINELIEDINIDFNFLIDESRLTVAFYSIKLNLNEFFKVNKFFKEKISFASNNFDDFSNNLHPFRNNMYGYVSIDPQSLIDSINSIKEALTEIENDKEGLDAIDDLCRTQKTLYDAGCSSVYLHSIYNQNGIDYLGKNLFDSSFAHMRIAKHYYQRKWLIKYKNQRKWVIKRLQAKLNLIIKYSAFPISEEKYKQLRDALFS